MRSAWLLVGLVAVAGCVDPAATSVDSGTEAQPPVQAPIIIEPVFTLHDASGITTHDIMLGDIVILNASATPTANLTSLQYVWLEQRDLLKGDLWVATRSGDHALQPRIIVPNREGSHTLIVAARSETGHVEKRMLNVGVSVEEEWTWDLATASPLEPPSPCQPGWSLLGEPATATQAFVVSTVPGLMHGSFQALPAPGVQIAWCQDGKERTGGEEGDKLVTRIDPHETGSEVVLWVANLDADDVSVVIERIYPGSPVQPGVQV